MYEYMLNLYRICIELIAKGRAKRKPRSTENDSIVI